VQVLLKCPAPEIEGKKIKAKEILKKYSGGVTKGAGTSSCLEKLETDREKTKWTIHRARQTQSDITHQKEGLEKNMFRAPLWKGKIRKKGVCST